MPEPAVAVGARAGDKGADNAHERFRGNVVINTNRKQADLAAVYSFCEAYKYLEEPASLLFGSQRFLCVVGSSPGEIDFTAANGKTGGATTDLTLQREDHMSRRYGFQDYVYSPRSPSDA